MKILMAHNHYLIPGGEDESFRAEAAMLREAGHEVETYTVHNERVAELGLLGKATAPIWSPESYRAVRTLLRETRADILHVQNFFPLISPSVYYAAHAESVPVVQTLRNYRLLCTNGYFYRDGRPCEDCLGKPVQYPGVRHRCYRESRPASAAVAAMNASHRLAGTWRKKVDLYIALTDFAREKFITAGWSPASIIVKPNLVTPDPGTGSLTRSGMFYAGRLSQEKGLATLLAAWEQLAALPVTLRIAGDGPLRPMVERVASQLPGVTYLGPLPHAGILDEIGAAEALIMPSEWYETFGRVIIEAYARGTPVIASRIGAVAEIVEDQRTGVLYAPGDVQGLIAAVHQAVRHPHLWRQMGHHARDRFTTTYSAAQNCDQLLAAYAAAKDVYARRCPPTPARVGR